MITERVLTDQMIAEIKAYFPRYPSRQAVTLPALHIVNEHLRYVPLQAVVEIAELLGLAPAQVQCAVEEKNPVDQGACVLAFMVGLVHGLVS